MTFSQDFIDIKKLDLNDYHEHERRFLRVQWEENLDDLPFFLKSNQLFVFNRKLTHGLDEDDKIAFVDFLYQPYSDASNNKLYSLNLSKESYELQVRIGTTYSSSRTITKRSQVVCKCKYTKKTIGVGILFRHEGEKTQKKIKMHKPKRCLSPREKLLVQYQQDMLARNARYFKQRQEQQINRIDSDRPLKRKRF